MKTEYFSSPVVRILQLSCCRKLGMLNCSVNRESFSVRNILFEPEISMTLINTFELLNYRFKLRATI